MAEPTQSEQQKIDPTLIKNFWFEPITCTYKTDSPIMLKFQFCPLRMGEQTKADVDIFQGYSTGPGVTSRRNNFWKLLSNKKLLRESN